MKLMLHARRAHRFSPHLSLNNTRIIAKSHTRPRKNAKKMNENIKRIATAIDSENWKAHWTEILLRWPTGGDFGGRGDAGQHNEDNIYNCFFILQHTDALNLWAPWNRNIQHRTHHFVFKFISFHSCSTRALAGRILAYIVSTFLRLQNTKQFLLLLTPATTTTLAAAAAMSFSNCMGSLKTIDHFLHWFMQIYSCFFLVRAVYVRPYGGGHYWFVHKLHTNRCARPGLALTE